MISISFMDILPSAITEIGFLRAVIAFFGGIILLGLLDFIIPHEYIEEHIKKEDCDSRIMKAGIYTAPRPGYT